jgi:hypothetical protein
VVALDAEIIILTQAPGGTGRMAKGSGSKRSVCMPGRSHAKQYKMNKHNITYCKEKNQNIFLFYEGVWIMV